FYRIQNGRSWTIHRQLADSFRTKRAVNVSHFFKEHPNGRNVGRSWHDVIRHLAVLHKAILPNYFLVQGVSNSLRDAACDLPARQDRMQHLADLLQRYKVV